MKRIVLMRIMISISTCRCSRGANQGHQSKEFSNPHGLERELRYSADCHRAREERNCVNSGLTGTVVKGGQNRLPLNSTRRLRVFNTLPLQIVTSVDETCAPQSVLATGGLLPRGDKEYAQSQSLGSRGRSQVLCYSVVHGIIVMLKEKIWARM